MKYKHILIVTYGRSGSTLLQGLLNSIDSCLVRGENFHACYGLFRAFDSFQKTKKQVDVENSLLSTSPWYGASLVDEEQFLVDARALLINQLAPPKAVTYYQCLGFKEIRYLPPESEKESAAMDLRNYLDFLTRLLPECALIFLTRDHEQVINSGWWKEKNPGVTKKRLTVFEGELANYSEGKSWVFPIEYRDMTKRTQRLQALFEFLGAPYSKKKINKVLSAKHSYAPKLKGKGGGGLWQSMNRLDLVAHASFDEPKAKLKAGELLVIQGVVVLMPELLGSYKLVAENPAGEEVIKWGMPSPAMAKKFPKNPHSKRARFRMNGVRLKDGQSANIYLVDNENNRYCLAAVGVGNKEERK
ncbi:MAG: hypothetical protein GXP10_01975 [Gammaproteobacteria bacterium]|nr:hypothetical protein [Gammaproteobacteria bacterium]